MSDNHPHVDGARVLSDLNALRGIGAYKTGVHKPTFSEPHMRSLQWLAQRLPEAGLDAEIDGIGNVLGTSTKSGPKLLAGSHLESQNFAGWLDGPLGVVYALEAARVINPDSNINGAVEVASWCDEEGHFGSLPRQPVLRRRCHRGGDRRRARPQQRENHARRPARRRSCRPAPRAGRTRPAYRISRGAYRARPDAGERRPCDRRRHLDRRHLAIPDHLHRRAKSCRHHPDGRAQGCRPGAGEVLRRYRRPVSEAERTAHGVDHRPHHARSRRAEHHPGQPRKCCSRCATTTPA